MRDQEKATTTTTTPSESWFLEEVNTHLTDWLRFRVVRGDGVEAGCSCVRGIAIALLEFVRGDKQPSDADVPGFSLRKRDGGHHLSFGGETVGVVSLVDRAEDFLACLDSSHVLDAKIWKGQVEEWLHLDDQTKRLESPLIQAFESVLLEHHRLTGEILDEDRIDEAVNTARLLVRRELEAAAATEAATGS